MFHFSRYNVLLIISLSVELNIIYPREGVWLLDKILPYLVNRVFVSTVNTTLVIEI